MHALSGPHGLGPVPGPGTNRHSVGARVAMCELRRGTRRGHPISSKQRKTSTGARSRACTNNGHEVQGKKAKALSPRGTPSISEYARPTRPPENDDWKAARRQTFTRTTNSRNAAQETSHAEVLSEECGDAAKILKVPGRSAATPNGALI